MDLKKKPSIKFEMENFPMGCTYRNLIEKIWKIRRKNSKICGTTKKLKNEIHKLWNKKLLNLWSKGSDAFIARR